MELGYARWPNAPKLTRFNSWPCYHRGESLAAPISRGWGVDTLREASYDSGPCDSKKKDARKRLPYLNLLIIPLLNAEDKTIKDQLVTARAYIPRHKAQGFYAR